ncbi:MULTISPECIES: STAS domain-containing protein [Nostocales]|uniref:Anti-sigma factor antagonist n=3 Tax=Nostocales TaxID=1161 RepID=A0A0C1QZG5_9CYAN|nr:STAS domain-containing protein [Tolypothrix bouteillei]KAF3885347.1 STAS domain-containing protein [Tolypothrix bouteillei VB521301]
MTFTQEYQINVLQPQGCLNLHQGEILREKLASLAPQPYHLWVIDLAQVDFMDSSGLGALVDGLSTTRAQGCRLVICNLQPAIRMIFELTQLDSQFEIFENYDAIKTTVNASPTTL